MSVADLEVIIAGQPFIGWQSVAIERSLDALAHTFSVQAITRWIVDDDSGISLRIDFGDAVEVWWGDALLLTGWVDEVAEEIAEESWSVTISGRSRAGDLCDCSAPAKTWRNTPGKKIAEELLAPYGLGLVLAPGADLSAPARKVASDGDDTVQEVLERIGEQLGLRVTSTPEGNIEFTAAGVRKAQRSLLYGQNIRQVRRSQNGAERFSEYIFRTQRSGTAAGDIAGDGAAKVSVSVPDAGVVRHRPLRVQAKKQGSLQELERRAAWERNTRAGKSDSLTIDVYDAENTWKSGPGPQDIWTPNTRVFIDVAPLDLREELLITSVSLGFGDGGPTTSLQLTHPNAYLPDKPPLKKKKKGKFSSW